MFIDRSKKQKEVITISVKVTADTSFALLVLIDL